LDITTPSWIEFIFTNINVESDWENVIDVNEFLFKFFIICKLGKEISFLCVTLITEIKEMPGCVFVVITKVFVNISTTSSLEVKLRVSSSCIIFLATYPSSKCSITITLEILVTIVVISCHSESSMVSLHVINRCPLEPTRKWIIFSIWSSWVCNRCCCISITFPCDFFINSFSSFNSISWPIFWWSLKSFLKSIKSIFHLFKEVWFT